MGERMERDWRDGLTFILCYLWRKYWRKYCTLGGSRNTQESVAQPQRHNIVADYRIMAKPPSTTTSNADDFYARALASVNHQISLAADDSLKIEVDCHAKFLVEDDLPKIESAAKGYLSLVAARSAVASDVDVLSASASAAAVVAQCTFAATAKTPSDANRRALICTRALLSAINSTIIPSDSPSTDISEDENKEDKKERTKTRLKNDATQILWNGLVKSSQGSTGDRAKQTKPSKVLGRLSLLAAYPFIQERFRRGIILSTDHGNNTDASTNIADDATTATTESENNPLHSFSNEVLSPVSPPKGIDIDDWEAFYTEFGHLLSVTCSINNGDEKELPTQSIAEHDDSALIWSSDKGSAELRSRRESRAHRASEALASVEGAKAAVADALVASTGGGDGEGG